MEGSHPHGSTDRMFALQGRGTVGARSRRSRSSIGDGILPQPQRLDFSVAPDVWSIPKSTSPHQLSGTSRFCDAPRGSTTVRPRTPPTTSGILPIQRPTLKRPPSPLWASRPCSPMITRISTFGAASSRSNLNTPQSRPSPIPIGSSLQSHDTQLHWNLLRLVRLCWFCFEGTLHLGIRISGLQSLDTF